MFIIQKRIFSTFIALAFLWSIFTTFEAGWQRTARGNLRAIAQRTFRHNPKMETYDGNYFRVCLGPGDCPPCSAVVVVVVAAITPPWHAGKDSALSNSAVKLLITFLWKLLEPHPRPAPPARNWPNSDKTNHIMWSQQINNCRICVLCVRTLNKCGF